MMTAKELINKWKENSLNANVLDKKVIDITARNFLDLTGAWFKNERKPKDVKPVYELRFSNNHDKNSICAVNEETAAYEIMINVLPNVMSYNLCELISIFYENGIKHENVLGSLTIV
jgi:hypothetical protein